MSDQPKFGEPGVAFIQWKGTDVCLDFVCSCGNNGHVDAQFAYVLRCPACDRRWTMPTCVQAVEGDSHDGTEPIDLS